MFQWAASYPSWGTFWCADGYTSIDGSYGLYTIYDVVSPANPLPAAAEPATPTPTPEPAAWAPTDPNFDSLNDYINGFS